MSLDLIRKYVLHGLYNEARRLIEIESDIYFLMSEDESSSKQETSPYLEDSKKFEKMPLLVILSLIKDEQNAISLSRLLLERGYHLDISDRNGLCAMNYAIALNRFNLVELYLNLFNVELNTHRDCHRNSFLHYAFATNDVEIIKKFAEVYSKFYEWDPQMFINTKNCDGLSIQDLYTFSMLKSSKNFTARTNIKNLPEYFNRDSNPITICKFINKIYNSNSTIKMDLIFVTNSARILSARSQINSSPLSTSRHISDQIRENKKQSDNRDFKLCILYQIRNVIKKKPINTEKFGDFNEIIEKNLLDYRNNRFSPICNEYHGQPRMMSSKTNSRQQVGLMSNIDSILESPILSSSLTLSTLTHKHQCWKSDLKKLYLDYEIINSASYHKPAVPMMIQWNDSVSGLYSPDFTKDGSEFTPSRSNSVAYDSNLSEFQDLNNNKKLRKGKNSLTNSIGISPLQSKELSKSKNYKILKAQSIDVSPEDEEKLIGLKNKKINRLTRQPSLSAISDNSEQEKIIESAKIVKPKQPSKWSNVLKKIGSASSENGTNNDS